MTIVNTEDDFDIIDLRKEAPWMIPPKNNVAQRSSSAEPQMQQRSYSFSDPEEETKDGGRGSKERTANDDVKIG
jgi:hypothetical protein